MKAMYVQRIVMTLLQLYGLARPGLYGHDDLLCHGLLMHPWESCHSFLFVKTR